VTRLAAAVPLLLLAACADRAPTTSSALPDEAAFARHVLAVVESYPTDGTHRYWWPTEGAWRGNARTLRYEESVVAEGDPEGRCHCCGLTFEVFLQAWQRWAKETGRPERILDLDVEGVRRLQTQWFGSPQDRSCLHTAIVGNGLGRRIERLDDARPGDFVQLWRTNGTGHSAVFLEAVREDGRIVGLRYWSTQGSTNGVARHVERFADAGGTVTRDELWICRVGRR
jgi:hypothetical protein